MMRSAATIAVMPLPHAAEEKPPSPASEEEGSGEGNASSSQAGSDAVDSGNHTARMDRNGIREGAGLRHVPAGHILDPQFPRDLSRSPFPGHLFASQGDRRYRSGNASQGRFAMSALATFAPAIYRRRPSAWPSTAPD